MKPRIHYDDRCFKVVNKNLCSSNIEGELAVQYKIGEWVRPKVGKLFCYDNLQEAKDFAEFNGGLVFQCDVLNPIWYSVMMLDLSQSQSPEDIKKFWEHCFGKTYRRDVKVITNLSSFPETSHFLLVKASQHTILADAVKLLFKAVDTEGE